MPERKVCNSALRIGTFTIIRCQLDEAHEGEHSASWDWENAEALEESDPRALMAEPTKGEPA